MSIFRNDTLGSWTRGGQAIVHNVRMTTCGQFLHQLHLLHLLFVHLPLQDFDRALLAIEHPHEHVGKSAFAELLVSIHL